MTDSHYAILCAELDANGRTTYAELVEKYGGRGYTYGAFAVAVHHARRLGLIAAPAAGSQGAIVAAGVCPHCGRRARKAGR